MLANVRLHFACRVYVPHIFVFLPQLFLADLQGPARHHHTSTTRH